MPRRLTAGNRTQHHVMLKTIPPAAFYGSALQG